MKAVEYGAGNGGTILLLHGGGLSWWGYREVAERLSGTFRVVLPVLDGHAGSDADFTGIGDNAERIIDWIDRALGGHVLLLGGLSLGAQVAAEVLARRPEICRFAVLESAAAIPDRLTGRLIAPALRSSYALVRQKWFARLQFRSLRLPPALFDDYWRDTRAITCENMIAFLRASTDYAPPESIGRTRAKVRVVVGGREQVRMRRSAERLRDMIPGSALEVMPGLRHGEYSMKTPDRFAADITAMIEGK